MKSLSMVPVWSARASVRLMLCFVLLAGGLCERAHAALPNGISGAWFNPAQGGHGLSVEMLGEGRAIVYWFVYDRDGAPLHLYVDGVVASRNIVGPAYRHDGMRFGTFDPTTVRQAHWGFVSVHFDDCNHGTLFYGGDQPAGAGFGSGSIPIVRLSRLAESTCDFGVADVLPPGPYDVDVSSADPLSVPKRLVAAIDPDGRLWATSPSPSSTRYVGARPNKPVIMGAVEARTLPWVPMQLRVFDDSAFGRDPPTPGFSLRGEAYAPAGSGTVSAHFVAPTPNGLADVISISPRSFGNNPLRGEIRLDDLPSAAFAVTFDAQTHADVALLRFRADGSFCLSAFNSEDPASCAWQGQIASGRDSWLFFDFTITRTIGAATHHYAGRGWFEGAPETAHRVVFVGADAKEGLGFVAVRRALP